MPIGIYIVIGLLNWVTARFWCHPNIEPLYICAEAVGCFDGC